MPQEIQKIIIDCDVGVDDALALILAFHSPELEVLAVTAVNGNVPLDLVVPNIKRVLTLIRPIHPPLFAPGADRPLRGHTLYSHSVHGETGLGNARIDFNEEEKHWRLYPGRAEELLPHLARQEPGEITLVAIGPLTNLGLALQRDPAGMKQFKKFVVMGGALGERGNVTPHAEFNFFTDPLAAKMVFEAGVPLTLVPLDATHQVFLTSQIIEEKILPIHSPFSRFVIDACQYDPARRRFRHGQPLVYLHDPLAIGVLIEPCLSQTEKRPLTIEAQEGEQWGKVLEGVPGSPMVDVCLKVDAERFINLFISRFSE
jgi:purine nucleosidase